MTEGFEKPMGNMQIRPFDKEWRGWICLMPSRATIALTTGIFSTVVQDAVYDVGKPIYANPYVKIRKYRIGPPNVMLPVSFLVDPDPRSQTKMPWYDVTDRDPDWIRDQLLHAIHHYAYPFFERTLTYEALLEAAMKYGTLNHAQQFSTPVLMMLTGRRAQLRDFVELCMSHMSDETASYYRRYIADLDPYLAAKGLLPD